MTILVIVLGDILSLILIASSLFSITGAEPEGDIGSALIGGKATWYCSESSACTNGYGPSDMVAAIDPTLGIPKGTEVTVCHEGDCIGVTVVDVCACADARIIDLTSGAFSRLAPITARVITVSNEIAGPRMTLPPTDTEEQP
jgi:rare lipoprotein A (peptidoglycan hydrolase)